MSKRNQKVLRRAPQDNNSSLISVDDISGLEKFQKKLGTKETNKENTGKNECNKEEFAKPTQVKKPTTNKVLNEKVVDITSTPFQGSRTVPLSNVFQEIMSPITRVSEKFTRPQTKIPVMKSKIPVFALQSVQSATTSVHRQKTRTEIKLPQRAATAPSLVPPASLPKQRVVKGVQPGELKVTVKHNRKQREDEKKCEDVKLTEQIEKGNAADAKPAEKAVGDKKNIGYAAREEEQNSGKNDTDRKEIIYELNKTRVLVSASGTDGSVPTSVRPVSLTKSNPTITAQQNLQPVKEVMFTKKQKEVKAVNRTTADNKKVINSTKTVNTEAKIDESEKAAKTKAKDAKIGSNCVDSDLALTKVKEQEHPTAVSASKGAQEIIQCEIKESQALKVSENSIKINKRENAKSEISEVLKNQKVTLVTNNKVCEKPNKENETDPSTKEINKIKLSGAVVEIPKAEDNVLTSKTEDGQNSKPIVSEHNPVQIIGTANAEHNLVNTEVLFPNNNEDIVDNFCDMELNIRKVLCKERKSKRQTKQREDSKFGNITTEEELMLSLFSPNIRKQKQLISDSQEQVTNVLSKRKAKPDVNANSKRGKNNADPLMTENSEKLHLPQDESVNVKKSGTASKRQVKQKQSSKANDEKSNPNQDEMCLRDLAASSDLPANPKRKSRKQMAVENTIGLNKPDKEDELDPTLGLIESKPQEPQRKRRATTRKQTKTATKGKKCDEEKVNLMSDDNDKAEIIQNSDGTQAKEHTNNVEDTMKTETEVQAEYMSDNKQTKKRKMELLTKTRQDCSVKVSNVNSEHKEICKVKEENPGKEHEQEVLPKDASSKKQTKTSKKQMDAVVECDERQKNSEVCMAEQEPSKCNQVSRKTQKMIPKRVKMQARATNHKEINLNIQQTDVCSLAVKITEGSNEIKTIPKNSMSIKTTELKTHNHLEIKDMVAMSSESGQSHKLKTNKANGEIKEDCINRDRINNKKRKIKEVEEDKDNSQIRRSCRKRLQTMEFWRNVANKSHIETNIDDKKYPEMMTGSSNSDDNVEQTKPSVSKRLEVEKNSSDEKSQPVGTTFSKLSVHHGEASRSFADRSGFKRYLSKWFSTGEVDFRQKDSEESGVLYAKCISINNTVAAGYIHIESGRTFSGIATNNTVYLIQKGNVKVELGGETRGLKRSQFFLIVPGVPFSVENKSKTSSVHLSYVKFRSVEP